MIKTKPAVLFLILGFLVASASVAGQSRDLPVYEVSRTATPIKVDGKLNDAVWANAPAFSGFRSNLDGSPPPYQTEAKALYDDKFLYFSFRSRDDNIWATYKTRDQPLWDEEVVVVFVQADSHQSSYIE